MPRVEIRADEGVAAFDVAVQIGQHAGVQKFLFAGNRLLGFAFKHFEKQRKLGDLHGLRVNIHAVNIVEQNSFAFVEWSDSTRRCGSDKVRAFCLWRVFRDHFGSVSFQMPVEQILISAQQKRAGTAGGVRRCSGCFARGF